MASLTSLTGSKPSPTPRLMTPDVEAACFETLRSAISDNAVALGQLRATKRGWRLQHLVDGVLGHAERAREAGLASAQAADEWLERRQHSLWTYVHELIAHPDHAKATLGKVSICMQHVHAA